MEEREDLGWWSGRLQNISELGYDVSGIAEELNDYPDMASSRLEQFEEYVEIAERLRMQLVRLPTHWEVARAEWMQLLDDPRHAPTVEGEFKRMQLTMRPWGLEADAHRRIWEKAGKLNALDEAVGRLDTLDISFALEATGVCNTIATSTDEESLLSEVVHLEEKQKQRVANLREMAELLELQGFHVDSVFDGGMAVAAERLERISNKATAHQNIASIIDNDIAPFDVELAKDYAERRSKIQTIADSKGEEELEQLEVEIATVCDSFRNRLARLQEKVEAWIGEGYVMPIEAAIPAEDLLIWEMKMPQIEQAIDAHDATWERIETGLAIWPEYQVEAADLHGDIEKIEDLVNLADNLEQLTKSSLVEGNDLMQSWADIGFSMALWKHRFDDDSRLALEEFKSYLPTLEEARRIVSAIERLDVSMGDGESASTHISTLQDAVLELDSIDIARVWLETRRKRNLRHRVMLEDEWRKLLSKGKGKDGVRVDELNLKEFEELVAGSGASRNMGSDSGSILRNEGAVERLEAQIAILIEDWSLAGWDTSGVSEIAENDIFSFGRMLSVIRSQMERHPLLRQRLEVLPVERSDDILTRLELDIRRPEKLKALWVELPEFAAALAGLEDVEDERRWRAWRPRHVHRPVLVPHVLEAIGDIAPPTPEVEALEAAIMAMGISPEEEDENLTDGVEIPLMDIRETEEIEVEGDAAAKPVSTTKKVTVGDAIAVVNGDWDSLLKTITRLVERLGLECDFTGDFPTDLASIRRAISPSVGIMPRDTRVDRLLRLTLRSIPPLDSNQDIIDAGALLVEKLSEYAGRLGKWTKDRLQYRNLPSTGRLLEDAEVLGLALERIPGPGIAIPLDADDVNLPTFEDYDDLVAQVEKLKGAIILSSVSNVVVASA